MVRVTVRQHDAGGHRRKAYKSQSYQSGVHHSNAGTQPQSLGWAGARKSFQRSSLYPGILLQYISNVRSSNLTFSLNFLLWETQTL